MKTIKLLIILFFPSILFAQIDHGTIEKLDNFFKSKNLQACIELANKYLKVNPNNTHLLYYKSLCEFTNNEFDSSIVHASIALNNINKGDTLENELKYTRAYAYFELKDFERALIDANSLVDNNIMNSDYYMFKAFIQSYFNPPNYKAAIETLNDCLKQTETQRHLIYNNLAYYSIENGDYCSAIDYADKGLNFATDSVWKGSLLNNKGFAIGLCKDINEGLTYVDKSLTYFPDNSYAYYYKGVLYSRQNNNELACRHFIKAKELGAVIMTKLWLEELCK